MKKNVLAFSFWILVPFLFVGCESIGEKSAGVSIIYCAAALFALILFIVYCCAIKKKNIWFILLFASVAIVNIGYFTLSVSQNLKEALLANRIAYLGSVFLPLSMLMIILGVAQIKYRKVLPVLLLIISIAVFLVAASPGYSDIYYKEVFFAQENGASVLHKVYGPWHCLYLFYLLGYFIATIIATVYSVVKRKMAALSHAVILIIAVFVNICVWLIEQLVDIQFEFLSISYIISELFLLGLHMVMRENARLREFISQSSPAQASVNPSENEKNSDQISSEPPEFVYRQFLSGISSLTKTEHAIFQCYLNGKTTKEILEELNIKENTLKFHNKNIYSKLGVSSRKHLSEIAKQLNLK